MRSGSERSGDAQAVESSNVDGVTHAVARESKGAASRCVNRSNVNIRHATRATSDSGVDSDNAATRQAEEPVRLPNIKCD